jgi:hypothetical protein
VLSVNLDFGPCDYSQAECGVFASTWALSHAIENIALNMRWTDRADWVLQTLSSLRVLASSQATWHLELHNLCSIEHSASRHQAAEFVAYKERILGTGTVDRGSDVQHRKLVVAWGICVLRHRYSIRLLVKLRLLLHLESSGLSGPI